MANIYSKKKKTLNVLKPKKETVSFLLNYSKALKVIEIGKEKQLIVLN